MPLNRTSKRRYLAVYRGGERISAEIAAHTDDDALAIVDRLKSTWLESKVDDLGADPDAKGGLWNLGWRRYHTASSACGMWTLHRRGHRDKVKKA